MSNRGWLLIFLDIWVNFYVIAFFCARCRRVPQEGNGRGYCRMAGLTTGS